MTLHIRELTFSTIIGILPHERMTPQKVILEVIIQYSYHTHFLNYAEIAQEIENVMKKEQFELIETALLTLFTHLKKKFTAINTLFIEIAKPDIMGNCIVSVAHRETFL